MLGLSYILYIWLFCGGTIWIIGYFCARLPRYEKKKNKMTSDRQPYSCLLLPASGRKKLKKATNQNNEVTIWFSDSETVATAPY